MDSDFSNWKKNPLKVEKSGVFHDQKSFSDFAENFVIYSSDKINFEIFGVLRNNFLMGLKINFKFEILGILVQKPQS